MTVAEVEKFVSYDHTRTWARHNRDWAVDVLTSWCHVARLREFAQEMDRVVAARRLHLVYARAERVA